jgi:UrcA family protein
LTSPYHAIEEMNVKRTNVLLASGLAAMAIGLASTQSFAATSADGVRSIEVSYAELDLTKPAGAQTLYERIKKAAYTVCGAYDSPMAWNYPAKTQCLKTAIDDAVAKVNSPLLTSLHRNENTRVASK